MKRLLLLLLPALLAACSDPNAPKREPITRQTLEVDGCKVKYIDPPNLPNFYIARCGDTTTTTWRQQNGKTTTTYASVNVESSTADLRKQLAESEARDKALAKLSPEDKQALGIK